MGETVHFLFWCPGCDSAHRFDTPMWGFNGDLKAPTFSPSLLNTRPTGHPKRCHLYLQGGRIRFLADCDHDLAGQTVDMQAWPNPDWFDNNEEPTND